VTARSYHATDPPIIVGLDGGYVHSSQQQSRTDGWFEVIAGKAIIATGRSACFGYVQTYDTKPKRRGSLDGEISG
jgi:hypothetical protein